MVSRLNMVAILIPMESFIMVVVLMCSYHGEPLRNDAMRLGMLNCNAVMNGIPR